MLKFLAWLLIMLIFRLFDALDWSLKLFKLKLRKFFGLHDYSRDIRVLEECQNDLTKIPRHLSVIIGTEKIDAKTISNIAVYALMLNISYITFYDIKGEFSLDQIIVPRFIDSKTIKNKFIWSMPRNGKTSRQLLLKNGMEKSIEITNISQQESISRLLEICQKLCTERNSLETTELLKNKNDLTEHINKIYKNNSNYVPDPDLTIIFDKTMCTFGFLPWQTGFTEFYNIDIVNFNVETFIQVLYSFSKCEQRFGK